jgi:serine/threonine protein kinase/tetratricopeptide (TPR) repeat protein
MTIAAGTRFDRYEILSPLGKGGMGEVYLALDTRLKRKVALKLLPAQFTQDADRMRRFEQEAQAASALNHPNIITIYEIGEADGTHFIATEFIDGETLRQRIAGDKMKLHEALDVAAQIASALTEAHGAGIVHRDIKPENVMVRPDGLVKVLDFGLAKLTELSSSSIDTGAPTAAANVNTETGAVMGTPRYMSPEQARGLKADARTDIFSLGVVLYEMIAGRSPFEGTTAVEVIAAILHLEPPPLESDGGEVLEALAGIITKALQKDREHRYQAVKDLALDLKRLKHRLELEAEQEHSGQPSLKEGAASSKPANWETARVAAAHTDEANAAPTISSTKILLGEIKRHKLGVSLTLAALLIAAVAAFFYFNRQPALTDKDTILLADFVNTTGDAVFDGTLKQAVAMRLEQSPFLNIFSDQRVQEALRLMGRAPETRVTKDLAQEICQRQRLKAMLVGSIAPLGNHYVITLEAINAQTGDVLAREQEEAESKEQVLQALGKAASSLRGKLGESLSSIQKFDTPIEEATTSSLEALKAFSLGRELYRQGKAQEAALSLKRAVELDPNFALAHYLLGTAYPDVGQPELGIEATQKAFELRDRTSEREKLLISATYYFGVTGELEKSLEALELVKQTYPRDLAARILLGFRYSNAGQYEKAIAEHREALRLNPNIANQYAGLAAAFTYLNRFDEAKEICEQALQQKLDITRYHDTLYAIAFIRGDAKGMQQEVDWASRRPDAFAHLNWQAEAATFLGQRRKAEGFSGQALEVTRRRNLKEEAANIVSERALGDALFGNCQAVKTEVAKSLASARTVGSLSNGGRALALCGEAGQAESLAGEIAQRFPKHTLAQAVWLPMIRAAIEIRRNNPAQAVQLLQGASRYEMALNVSLWPAYLRGLAYLKQGAGKEAIQEFQKILDHRGAVAVNSLYPLAHLGLARAAALTGDTAKSRKAYQDFLALWKDADVDLPILIEAKKEYEKVK